MKKKNLSLTIMLCVAFIAFTSCSIGKGDLRDRNLEQALMVRLDSVPEVEYIGMSDVHELDEHRLKAVIIYFATDSTGSKTERNARVTTNDDCSKIYSWEDLGSTMLEDTKQAVKDKLEEIGIDINGSLIDAIIKLKRR